MNAYTWIGILGILGILGVLVNRRTTAAHSEAFRTRHGIGLGFAAFGCVLMNVGALASDEVSGVLQVCAAVVTVVLLGALLGTTAHLRASEAD